MQTGSSGPACQIQYWKVEAAQRCAVRFVTSSYKITIASYYIARAGVGIDDGKFKLGDPTCQENYIASSIYCN